MLDNGRKISVFGLGYVGSVTAACFAHKGHTVWGFDTDPAKTDAISQGRAPVKEPGMTELVSDAVASGRLRSCSSVQEAVAQTDVSFVCVGTPISSSGQMDLTQLTRVCEEIGFAIGTKSSVHCIVIRSTILPGTTQSTVIPALERTSKKRAGVGFNVCVNPEFTRQGSAVKDFLQPAVTVFGSEPNLPGKNQILHDCYAWVSCEISETDFRTAEMIKCTANAWHATKIAFANEIGSLAVQQSVDVTALMKVFLSDTKLNVSSSYLTPGFAFGGSCLPKDVRALQQSAHQNGLVLPLIDSILESNEEHLHRSFKRIARTGKTKIGLLGITFKPTTDDFRGSPQIRLATLLLNQGFKLSIYDPNLPPELAFTDLKHLAPNFRTSIQAVLREADVVVLGASNIKAPDVVHLLGTNQTLIDLSRLTDEMQAPENVPFTATLPSPVL